ncbi:hypothetical protein [Hoeflea prorocentri]|uniref:Uncharacterized protein n=1 Tax=Hoeflea prorocentri TaxID=1922333 RepID=A0A9X3ZFP4_9HYPH|nr:hypothetical protein [Hoeflea prorocentri]MCY6379917.1 hypothetical protein [Hoeflea prorocentri]MDA5397717.1 hypothetical protein [Hoeflea prorocentri]
MDFDGESVFDNDSVGGVSADDTYSGSYTGGGHFAFTRDYFLMGAFAGAGQTFFHETSTDHDVTQRLAGGQTRFLNERGSLGLQIGHFDTRADSGNMETLIDAMFVWSIGQVFFNNGATMREGVSRVAFRRCVAGWVRFRPSTDAPANFDQKCAFCSKTYCEGRNSLILLALEFPYLSRFHPVHVVRWKRDSIQVRDGN